MANNSSNPDSTEEKQRDYYFINEIVEDKLIRYNWTGCTDVELRDSVMSHAEELISQIIRKQGLQTIYMGHEETSFKDLIQVAWMQIERVLYKFRAKPHCRKCYNPVNPQLSLLYNSETSRYGIVTFKELANQNILHCHKCKTKLEPLPRVEPKQGTYGGSESVLYRGPSKVFNMWSQVARTVILAHIKKEGRDRKNSNPYKDYIANRHRNRHELYISDHIDPNNEMVLRFLVEARDVCKYNDDYIKILDALEFLVKTDSKPHDSIMGKLIKHAGVSRITVTNFMKEIRLRSFEFTDSPINKNTGGGVGKRGGINVSDAEDDI